MLAKLAVEYRHENVKRNDSKRCGNLCTGENLGDIIHSSEDCDIKYAAYNDTIQNSTLFVNVSGLGEIYVANRYPLATFRKNPAPNRVIMRKRLRSSMDQLYHLLLQRTIDAQTRPQKPGHSRIPNR